MAKILSEADELECRDRKGRTPLFLASSYGHETSVRLLLDNGAQPDMKDVRGQTPLSWAIEGGNRAVVKLLLDTGAKVDYQYQLVSESH